MWQHMHGHSVCSFCTTCCARQSAHLQQPGKAAEPAYGISWQIKLFSMSSAEMYWTVASCAPFIMFYMYIRCNAFYSFQKQFCCVYTWRATKMLDERFGSSSPKMAFKMHGHTPRTDVYFNLLWHEHRYRHPHLAFTTWWVGFPGM